jgi:sugar phosphate isomerase/epimerase
MELPFRKALLEAQRLGVAGVQFDAVGDLSPAQLSQTGRRELRNILRSHNLELTAVGCPLRRGLDVAEDQQPRLERIKQAMTLSYDLGARIAIVQAGQVPEDQASTRARLLHDALEVLGRHGEHVGTFLALETGLESGAVLAEYLRTFDSGSLAVNFDPANLLLHGFDVYDSLRQLHGKVVHAHAKDARAASASRAAQEVPLGQGDIDWMLFVATLEEIEYQGWLTLERESGSDRLRDLADGVALLRRFIQ